MIMVIMLTMMDMSTMIMMLTMMDSQATAAATIYSSTVCVEEILSLWAAKVFVSMFHLSKIQTLFSMSMVKGKPPN